MGTQFTLPPATRAVGTGNPPLDMDNVINALLSQGAALNVLNQAYSGGADPTGATDSTTAINAALTSAAPGQYAYLPPGIYTVSAPIAVPPHVGLIGVPSTSTIGQGSGSSGSVLRASAGFTAGTWPLAAVVLITDQVTGGYSISSEEQHIRWIMIDGTLLPGTSNVAGLGTYVAPGQGVGRISVQDTQCYGLTGWGVAFGGGNTRMHNVHARNNGRNHALNAGGLQIHNSDSEFIFCGSYSNYGDGWQITDSFDSIFSCCHSEHSSAGNGFSYTADYDNSTSDVAGGVCFTGCTVDGANWHGFFLTSSGGRVPPVSITGGFSRRCGEASTSAGYAGYCVSGYDGPVSIAVPQCYPDTPDGGGSFSPQYGLSCVSNGSATFVSVTGGALFGYSSAFHIDGSQALLTIGPDVTFGSGSGSGTLSYTPGVALQAASSSELLPVDPVLYRQAQACVATTHDRADVTGTFSPNSGIPYWHLVTLIAGVPVTSIWSWVTGTGKTGGSHGWVAIVPVATGKIVAVSADQTDASTTWGTTGQSQPVALTSAYTPPFTGAYWFGVSITATGMPTLGLGTVPDAGIAIMPPILCGSSGAQTTPPSVGATGGPTGGVAADDIYLFAT